MRRKEHKKQDSFEKMLEKIKSSGKKHNKQKHRHKKSLKKERVIKKKLRAKKEKAIIIRKRKKTLRPPRPKGRVSSKTGVFERAQKPRVLNISKHVNIKKTIAKKPALKIIKKTLRSPRTKVRGLSGFLDAQRAPRPKGSGFSKHVDIKKHNRPHIPSKRIKQKIAVKHPIATKKSVVKSHKLIHAKPLIKQPEIMESKEAMHSIVTQQPISIPEETEKENFSIDLVPETEELEDSEKEPLHKESEETQKEEKEETAKAAPQQKPVEEKKSKKSFLSRLFSHSNKEQEELTEQDIAKAKNMSKEEEEMPSISVSTIPQKVKGNVIEAYTIKLDGASADIKIVRNEINTSYVISLPKISVATTALLNDLREELITITSVSMQELIDPKAFSSIKNKFKEEAKKLIRKKIPTIKEDTESFIIGTLMQEMLGIGRIEYLINDPNLEEIVIVSAKEPIKVYSKKYGWLSTNIILKREEVTINYSNIIARRVGRQITVLSPLLDAHLVTGDRVNAVLYPINTKGNTIVIRKFSRDPYTIIDLIKNNTCDLEAAALLWLAVEYEMNVIISGGTASGKTVLLNACMPFIPPNQRIISIEDTKELMLPEFLYWTPLVTRLPNAEGKGAVTMLDLLINSLRMRPDRIILGEMRKHEEAMVLFEAMHTGHSVYATLHADSAAETISRLTHQPLDIPANLLKAINLNVVMFRDRRRGIRRILQIAEIETEGDSAKANTLYRWSPENDKLVRHNKSSRFFEEISRHTSMSEDEINKELELKKKILTWLMKHNIRKLDDLGKTVNLYYQNKELLLKKIAKDDINFVLNYGK